jgi:hypothetical protein
MRFVGLMLLLAGLAGCAGVADQARLVDAQQTHNNEDDNACRAQGITTGTELYFQCRTSMAQKHLDDAEAKVAERRAEAAHPDLSDAGPDPFHRTTTR